MIGKHDRKGTAKFILRDGTIIDITKDEYDEIRDQQEELITEVSISNNFTLPYYLDNSDDNNDIDYNNSSNNNQKTNNIHNDSSSDVTDNDYDLQTPKTSKRKSSKSVTTTKINRKTLRRCDNNYLNELSTKRRKTSAGILFDNLHEENPLDNNIPLVDDVVIDGVDNPMDENGDIICAICLYIINADDAALYDNAPCNHTFHKNCLLDLRRPNLLAPCPLCRRRKRVCISVNNQLTRLQTTVSNFRHISNYHRRFSSNDLRILQSQFDHLSLLCNSILTGQNLVILVEDNEVVN